MQAILIHGMGRTPLSMMLLAARLRLAGLRPKLFAYSAACEGWQGCTDRLQKFIEKHDVQGDYIIVGHSLGAVLTRAVIPALRYPPKACFLIVPPSDACKAARKFASLSLYRLLTGEMGQLLASRQFMNALPQPNIATRIYAGTGGSIGRYSPFGENPNDGVLTLHETLLPSVPVKTVPSIHTFIMNAKIVAQDIIQFTDGNGRKGQKFHHLPIET